MTQDDTPLLVRREGPVVRAIMNRPQRRNALSVAMGLAWEALIEELREDRSARVLVISGAGGHFCAGADLTEVGEPETPEQKLARQQDRNRRAALVGHPDSSSELRKFVTESRDGVAVLSHRSGDGAEASLMRQGGLDRITARVPEAVE